VAKSPTLATILPILVGHDSFEKATSVTIVTNGDRSWGRGDRSWGRGDRSWGRGDLLETGERPAAMFVLIYRIFRKLICFLFSSFKIAESICNHFHPHWSQLAVFLLRKTSKK
jgi:hypothetical protein